LFITASCDFAPHDDPAKNSLGAGILTGNANGAIALLTTTRLVFAYSNRVINDNYLKIALKPLPSGQYLTLGESVKQAKNFTSLSSGDLLNNRKFTLLGDPAMRLAFPELRLQLTAINGTDNRLRYIAGIAEIYFYRYRNRWIRKPGQQF
jgi:hypothetical protein